MPANYTLAKQCQVFPQDIEDALRLSQELLDATASPSAPVTESSSAASPTLSMGPVIGAVVAESHARSLLLNTLVRLLVPVARRDTLIRGNRHIRAVAEAATAKKAREQAGSDARGTFSGKTGPAAAGGVVELPQHRAGRIVGVVAKPRVTAPHGPEDWLLAVYLGECVEPFSVAAVSADPLTEEEHRAFLLSCVGLGRAESASGRSILPSQQPALLSTEMAAGVKQALLDVRRIGLLSRPSTSPEVSARLLKDLASKRHREDDDDDDTKRSRVEEKRHPRDRGSHAKGASEEAERDMKTFFGDGAASQAAHIARLTNDLETRATQIGQLRQQLQQKEWDAKSALQTLQQAEEEHRRAVDVWRGKVEEQGRAMEQAKKEADLATEQRDALLTEANEKMRRLAALTTSYKQVVDLVGQLLRQEGDGEGNSGAGRTMTPAEILAMLQKRKRL